MKTLLLGLVGALLLIGCTRYSNQVTTEGGGTLSTTVSSFGAKVDFKGLQSDKELGPNGLKQTTVAAQAGGEAQLRDVAAIFLAGSQAVGAATGGGNQGLSPELFSALLDKIPGPTIVTNAPPDEGDD